MSNRFVTIDYDEMGDISSYKGIKISLVGGEVLQSFASGNVVKDFEAMVTWLGDNPIEGRTMYTSSVDHFVMDIAGFKWTVDDLGRELIVAMTPEEIAGQSAERGKESEAEKNEATES
jgi:hypothetical protein|nr:hypothetical protein [Neorhizobium tomejilense]